MRFSTAFTAATAISTASALAIKHEVQEVLGQHPLPVPAEQAPEQYLIELEPGNTRWVTEEEKWELKRVII